MQKSCVGNRDSVPLTTTTSDVPMKPKSSPSLLSELLRRRVVRLLIAYVVVLYVVVQGLVDIVPLLGLPEWTLRAVLITGIAAIPAIVFVSWKFDLTPPRLVRDKMDAETISPGLDWARRRHDNLDAGYVELKWTGDGQTRQHERFFRALSIGRGLNNDVNFSSRLVSRHHAVLWAESGAWRICDLNSANGTFIGETRVTGTSVLPPSCCIYLGPNGPMIEAQVDKPDETRLAD
jgi:hypothetical protein